MPDIIEHSKQGVVTGSKQTTHGLHATVKHSLLMGRDSAPSPLTLDHSLSAPLEQTGELQV